MFLYDICLDGIYVIYLIDVFVVWEEWLYVCFIIDSYFLGKDFFYDFNKVLFWD